MNETGQTLTCNRRFFLKSAMGGVVLATLSHTSSLFAATTAQKPAARSQSSQTDLPILEVEGPADPGAFLGDEPSKGHEIFWNKQGYLERKGGLPKPTQKADVVVVGGGLAGLAAAYRLRARKPLVLEQSSRFGGNAKGERWQGIPFGMGSAYIARPESGSALEKLVAELKLEEELRYEEPGGDAVLLGKRLQGPFWKGASDPARKDDFTRVHKLLSELWDSGYPTIPAATAEEAAKLATLDRMSFADWLSANAGKLHPHVEELLNEYCWDALAGSSHELSAAQVLNFLVADLVSGTGTFPGANARLAERMLERLRAELPAGSLRASTPVVDVRTSGNQVLVTYEDPATEKLVCIEARACIVAAPKFAAKKIVSGLPETQSAALRKLKYRAFLVANVLLAAPPEGTHSGAFNLAGSIPTGDLEAEDSKRAFTSVISANWASKNRSAHSVLTLYKPLPFSRGRSKVFPQGSYARVRSQFEKELPRLVEAFGADLSRVQGVRIARWGHALPLAEKGLLADGTLEQASRPVAGRIFFAGQDNWANPCVETAVGTASVAATSVEQLLAR